MDEFKCSFHLAVNTRCGAPAKCYSNTSKRILLILLFNPSSSYYLQACWLFSCGFSTTSKVFVPVPKVHSHSPPVQPLKSWFQINVRNKWSSMPLLMTQQKGKQCLVAFVHPFIDSNLIFSNESPWSAVTTWTSWIYSQNATEGPINHLRRRLIIFHSEENKAHKAGGISGQTKNAKYCVLANLQLSRFPHLELTCSEFINYISYFKNRLDVQEISQAKMPSICCFQKIGRQPSVNCMHSWMDRKTESLCNYYKTQVRQVPCKPGSCLVHNLSDLPSRPVPENRHGGGQINQALAAVYHC